MSININPDRVLPLYAYRDPWQKTVQLALYAGIVRAQRDEDLKRMTPLIEAASEVHRILGQHVPASQHYVQEVLGTLRAALAALGVEVKL